MNCSPWKEAPYEDAAERTAIGGLSSDAFLSLVINTPLTDAQQLKEHFVCMHNCKYMYSFFLRFIFVD